MELTKNINITSNTDCSLTYTTNDWYKVNIYQNIDGIYELSNKTWVLFLPELWDETCFETIIEYMVNSEKNYNLLNNVL